MSHRRAKKNISSRYESLINELDKHQNSPLQGLAKNYKEILQDVRFAYDSKSIDQKTYDTFLNSIYQIVQILPESFNERYLFDHYTIESICERWNKKSQILSFPLITKHYQEWAHQSTLSPVDAQNGQAKSINLICFPGEDRIDNIDLLEYPFLFHELGHNLLFYTHPIFADKFTKELDTILASIRLRAISDKGLAKSRTEEILQKISHYWLPKDNQKDWSHEIAVDLIALWACGPAFLKAFQLELDHNTPNPFLLDDVHPPYAFRIEVILTASEKLGFQRYSNELEKLLDKWRYSPKDKDFYSLNNLYQALTSEKLKEAIISVSFAVFRELSIPICSLKFIQDTERRLERGQRIHWGTQLILAASLYHDIYDDEEFDVWEQNTIKSLINEITQ